MQLLRPFTGTASVFFPIGPPPAGTCQFATAACLRACYVADPSDFDEETRVPEAGKREIQEAVTLWPIDDVRRTFLRDLYGLQTPILSWFGSGDCLSKDVDRISAIIRSLPTAVIQMGFTRNRELWERHKDIFALSIEHEADAPDVNAMYSIPDYERETSVMYSPGYQVRGGYCGPLVCTDRDRARRELIHYINCRTCHRLRAGCFDRRQTANNPLPKNFQVVTKRW